MVPHCNKEGYNSLVTHNKAVVVSSSMVVVVMVLAVNVWWFVLNVTLLLLVIPRFFQCQLLFLHHLQHKHPQPMKNVTI